VIAGSALPRRIRTFRNATFMNLQYRNVAFLNLGTAAVTLTVTA
jgi:hypothetical protein